jgi:TadE-like protein
MIRLRHFLGNERGATAAEFALVLPVALLFLLGTFDMGRYLWEMNKMEKAVQAGTRYAVSTEIVASGLNDESYIDVVCPGGTLKAGDTICKEALDPISCTKSGGGVTCSCSGNCPGDLTGNTTAFDNIVRRMRVMNAAIGPGNVTIKYSGSGIGFAGDPNEDDDGDKLSEISPVVTVEVASVRFRSMSLLGAGITLPGFRYSQTLEDGDGAVAY